jgi:hypothetical protein
MKEIMERIKRTLQLFIFTAFLSGYAWGTNDMANGFNRDEALQLLELCAELNGYGVQDAASPDTKNWKPVAEGMDPNNKAKEYGFGPFNNRWKLWQREGSTEYAVVIRGTIYDAQSIKEDFLANSLPAEKVTIPAGTNKSISFRLASTAYQHVDEAKDWPVPEVHAGFAYGLAAILFDKTHGLIKALNENVPSGSHVFITGHSQGAAIATLLPSFLHYACADGEYKNVLEEDKQNFRDCPRFGMEEKNWTIKTYVFAQPKPGNWRYAMDLAQSIGNKGMIYAINNYDDPVVQVPLAFQLLSDSLTKQEADAIGSHRFMDFMMSLASDFRKVVSSALDEQVLDDIFLKSSYADQIDTSFVNGPAKTKSGGGTSLNYTPSGNIIAVRSRSEDNLEKYNKTREGDFLWEHHLWRYKQLSKYWP